MSDNGEETRERGKLDLTVPPICKGSGFDAILDERTGFYGCPACGVPLGVVLRSQHTTPEHPRGMMLPVDPAQRFHTEPHHRGVPILMMAEASGLSKDWTIDLLVRALFVTQAELRRLLETTAKPSPTLILSSEYDPRKDGAPS